jgi:hypothetical protein
LLQLEGSSKKEKRMEEEDWGCHSPKRGKCHRRRITSMSQLLVVRLKTHFHIPNSIYILNSHPHMRS